jgi:hypothetical protein
MLSKTSHEGYLLIDHRDSPGLSEEAVHNAGMPPGSARGVFEVATFTCSHCCRVVIIDPRSTNSPPYCAGCNRYICKTCGAIKALTGECKTFLQVVEEHQEAVSRQEIITP